MLLETLLGSLTGFIGTGITAYSNYKMAQIQAEEKKADHTFELAKIQAETEAMIKETEANLKVTETLVQGSLDLEEQQSYDKSQTAGNKQSLPSEWLNTLFNYPGGLKFLTIPTGIALVALLGMADVLRGLMRPSLTLYIVVVASWITYISYGILLKVGPSVMAIEQAVEIWTDACSLMLMLMVTLVTWWFGDRRMAKNMGHFKMKDIRNGR